MSSLAGLGRRRFVSTNALAEVLKEVKKSGLPKATSSTSIKRARQKELDEMSNQFGDMITFLSFECYDAKGKLKTVRLPFIQPLVFLQHIVGHCTSFQRYYAEHLAGVGEDPSNPLENLSSTTCMLFV